MSSRAPYAFPVTSGHDFWVQESGMTLRDWFAGQALVGVMSSSRIVDAIESAVNKLGKDNCYPVFAEAAYEIADAMLATREQGK